MNFIPFNNIISPIKTIHNFYGQMNCSYANAVLQCLACLNCIRKWYSQLNRFSFMKMNNIPNPITKDFYNLLFILYSGGQPDSSSFISNFNQKIMQYYKKETKADPFHFLFYFLDLLHMENNNAINRTFNVNEYLNPSLTNMQNNSYMHFLYVNYSKSTKNSVVSTNFLNSCRYKIDCKNSLLNCPSLYYYKARKIIEFDVDNFRRYRDQARPYRMNMNLSLEECLLCYQGGKKFKCQICGCFNAYSYNNIWSSNRVLIFYFKRMIHNFLCDIDFGTKIDMSDFCKYNDGNIKYIYNLKACISLSNFYKYFADIEINGNWFRYMEGQFKTLSSINNEIFIYEPQLLIYEIEEPKIF